MFIIKDGWVDTLYEADEPVDEDDWSEEPDEELSWDEE